MYIGMSVIKGGIVEFPRRAHPHDAGIDFFMPVFNEAFLEELYKMNNTNNIIVNKNKRTIIIKKLNSIIIPSMIKVQVPIGHALIFLNTSKMAAKKNLILGAQVIDTYYSGNIYINLHNISSKDVILYEHEKIAQAVLFPIISAIPTQIDENDLYAELKEKNFREAGAFGSTNKKVGD